MVINFWDNRNKGGVTSKGERWPSKELLHKINNIITQQLPKYIRKQIRHMIHTTIPYCIFFISSTIKGDLIERANPDQYFKVSDFA